MTMNQTDLDRLAKTVIAADPTFHGWQIVEDVIGVDPYLLCEWIKEGAEGTGPIYQFDAGGHTAWAYRSRVHGGWLVADTTDNQSYVYTGPMDDITLQVAARLVSDEINWLFETAPLYSVHQNSLPLHRNSPIDCPQDAGLPRAVSGQLRPTPVEAL
jgi:hypothetical protein